LKGEAGDLSASLCPPQAPSFRRPGLFPADQTKKPRSGWAGLRAGNRKWGESLFPHAPFFADPGVRIRTTIRSDRDRGTRNRAWRSLMVPGEVGSPATLGYLFVAGFFLCSPSEHGTAGKSCFSGPHRTSRGPGTPHNAAPLHRRGSFGRTAHLGRPFHTIPIVGYCSRRWNADSFTFSRSALFATATG
jgi:hypothetical protein